MNAITSPSDGSYCKLLNYVVDYFGSACKPDVHVLCAIIRAYEADQLRRIEHPREDECFLCTNNFIQYFTHLSRQTIQDALRRLINDGVVRIKKHEKALPEDST